MALKIILGWLVFVALVYMVMYFEYAYYTKDLTSKFKRIIDTFTEEE